MCRIVGLNLLVTKETVTSADFMPWFKKVDELIKLASSFENAAVKAGLQEQLEKAGDMYKVLTGTLRPDQVKGEHSCVLCGRCD